jgi:hypothetical protein
MSVLANELRRLLEFLSDRGYQPAATNLRILEVPHGAPVDETGRIRVLRTDLYEPSEYAARFDELLAAGPPWLNLSCYGVLDDVLVVAVEVPAWNAKPSARTSVNLSGPSRRVLARDWNVDGVLALTDHPRQVHRAPEPEMAESFEMRLTVTREAPRDNSLMSEEEGLARAIDEICAWLAKNDAVRFEVAGFGSTWRVDVATDLSVVAEQLPTVLAGLRRSREVELDFYEQGIQRVVTFDRADEQVVRVSCRSGLAAWSPMPGELLMKRRDVVQMLETFARTFIEVANAACPGPASHRTFRAWQRELEAAVTDREPA